MRFIVIYLFSICSLSWGQQRFYKLYSGAGYDKGEDILVLPDSSYVVAGSSGSWEQSAQGFLLKLDHQGNYQWSQAYGIQETEEVKRVFQRPGLGYYMAGISNSWSGGSYDPMVIYTDLFGNKQWIKTYESPSWERIHDGVQTIDTGMVLVGERQAVLGGSADIFLMKLDKNGDTLWTKSFGTTGDDRAFSIQRISDTSYAIGGEWYVADSAMQKGFIAEINDNGSLLWQTILGNHNGAYQISDLTQTPDGIMFVGFHMVNTTNYDHFSGTVDLNGNIIQQVTHFDSPSTIENNRFQQIHYLPQLNLSVIGYQTINSLTNQDDFDLGFGYFDALYGFWMPNYSGTTVINDGLDQIAQIKPTHDGGYVAVGTNANVLDNQNALNGGSNVFVLKIDLNGGGEIQTDTVLTLNQLVALNPIDQESSFFGIYPNPTSNLTKISAFTEEPLVLHIYNQQGSCLQTIIVQDQYELDLSEYSNGIYYLESNGSYLKLLKQ